MPGIFGAIRFREPGPPGSLEIQFNKMLAPAQQPADLETVRAIFDDRAVFASINLPGDRRTAQNGNCFLAFDGEIVDLHPAAGELLADFLLERYLHEGDRAFADLNGFFTACIWDNAERRLTLVTDRYGMRKLYTCHAPDGTFLFASEIKALSAFEGFDRSLSPLAAAELLSFGYSLDDRTLFENVRLAPPAAVITVVDGHMKERAYWNYPFYPSPRKRGENEMTSGLIERVETAVKRRLRENACLMLTAGYDSRLLAGAIRGLEPDMPFRSVTLGQPGATDVVIGAHIARQARFTHETIDIPPTYLVDLIDRIVWKTEGNMNAYAGWIILANDYFLAQGIDYALSGIGGEAISGRHLLIKQLDPDPARAIDAYLAHTEMPGVINLLKAPLGRELRDQMKFAMWNLYQRTPEDAPTLNRLDYLNFYQDMRRHATTVDIFSGYTRPLDPFLDNDLFEYALTIPPALRARGYIFRKAILKALPADLKRIGDKLRGPSIRPEQEAQYQKMFNLYKGLMRRVRRMKAGSKSIGGDNTENYILPNTWLRTVSRARAEQIIGQREYLEDWFDIDQVNRLVSEHMEGRSNEYITLSALMTLITWQKLFA